MAFTVQCGTGLAGIQRAMALTKQYKDAGLDVLPPTKPALLPKRRASSSELHPERDFFEEDLKNIVESRS